MRAMVLRLPCRFKGSDKPPCRRGRCMPSPALRFSLVDRTSNTSPLSSSYSSESDESVGSSAASALHKTVGLPDTGDAMGGGLK